MFKFRDLYIRVRIAFNFEYSKNLWFFKEYLIDKSGYGFIFSRANLFAATLSHVLWLKARVAYYLNNWVYTTNHKRIAINYFWFVTLGAIFGLVLATLIRLEMAYPGAGILAGDSLQYLSIVTAHGVIMVFFMIIPLLFGAYSNFLIPTQLGVHDVAFPRLNSAAFWFLPAGLIMLGQMVCIDRRYQRMNCFNVREYESLLKRKFFFDLVNTSDYRDLMDKTIINLRYKTNDLNLFTHSSHLFGNLGLKSTSQYRVINYITPYLTTQQTWRSRLIDSFSVSNFGMLIYQFIFRLFDGGLPHFQLNGLNHWLSLRPNCDISQPLNSVTSFNGTNLTPLVFSGGNFYNFFSIWVSQLLSTNIIKLAYDSIIDGVSTGWLGIWITQLIRTNIFTLFYEALTNNREHSVSVYTSIQNLRFITYLSDYFSSINIDGIRLFTSIWVSQLLHTNIVTLYLEAFKDGVGFKFLGIFNLVNVPFDLVTSIYSYLVRLMYTMYNVSLFSFGNYNNSSLNFLFYSNVYSIYDYFLNLVFFTKPIYSNSQLGSVNFDLSFYVNAFTYVKFNDFNLIGNIENFNNKRFLRFNTPVFKFDFKSGVYLTDAALTSSYHLLNTSSYIAKTGRTQPQWFYSSEFCDSFALSFNAINKNIINAIGQSLSSNEQSQFTYTLPTQFLSHFDIFFFFWTSLANDTTLTNRRWVALVGLNQKFQNFFLASSTQQRVYSNWRQLKFTREAWRCRLLVARHQKSMYRRYVNADGVFWSLERNAKDLLPGWAMVTPFSSRTRYTLVGKTDIGLFGVFLSITGSMFNSINFLITYRYLSTLNNRKMRDARAFFTEAIIVASWMIVSANPMLGLAILMLISDRHWRTSFFDYSGGGDSVLFQHMFWFFGHPEVYIIMIPCFGFTNTIMSYYLRKRISARSSLIYSMYTIAFLGFFVWGHHMYMVGLAHTTRMLYSTLTVMISVPAATKIMHWLVTFVNGTLHLELPLVLTMIFIFLFLSGGISGMAVAHTGTDVLFHDTLYVVGHFHIMLAGSAVISCFAAFYFYFPALFGVKYSKLFAYLHALYYIVGNILTFVPMLWLGYAGMPRRILDYPLALAGWHSFISAAHLLSIAGVVCFFVMLFDSIRRGKAAIRNTFGVGRYNTRLNFYSHEISRLHYIRRKTLSNFRVLSQNQITLNGRVYSNYEPLETTLLYYVLSNNKTQK